MSRRTPPAPSDLPLLALGDAIAKAREGLGLSQHELSVALGLTVGTISRWERGKGIPEVGQARLLERLLGVQFVPAARILEPSAERLALLQKALRARSRELLAEVEAKLSKGTQGLSQPAATPQAPQAPAQRGRKRTA